LNRPFRTFIVLWCIVPTLAAGTAQAADARRPNILVLMGDDWSWPHAAALGDPVVKTPALDRLVREGVLFQHAFVSAPSCTPSRLAIVTGQDFWRLREGANLGGSLTADVPVYPELLQASGYKIGFAGKGAEPSKYVHTHRDPNGPRFKSFASFLAERKGGEPFCFWQGGGPHRPFIWQEGIQVGLRPGDVKVPGCLPDNETVRTDLCDYYHRIERFDREAAEMLRRLEHDGELENTIVVMTGDNGLPFPRCKATLYDTGTRVPLAIRWGARVSGGRRIDDFVSLCDLAPTLLEAAGLKPAAQMTGRTLLPMLLSRQASGGDAARPGPARSSPWRSSVVVGMERHVFAHPCRALRSVDYLYIENFGPAAWPMGESHSPSPPLDSSSGAWPSDAAAFSFNIDPSPTKQFLLQHRGEPAVKPFFALACGPRPPEELYDLRKDPQQLRNVADQGAYRQIAGEMRARLEARLRAAQDPRLLPKGFEVSTIEGWTVLVDDRLREQSPLALDAALVLLRGQLQTIVARVPADRVSALRTVPLWLSPEYPGAGPKAEYHPGAEWLCEHARNPAMVKGVEFSNVRIFEAEVKRMPVFVLHELAHAYHDLVLGFDNAEVQAAYDRAVKSKSYDAVERRPGKLERAYAVTNPREYFAETTEALFGVNDFYPFNRDDLRRHDPEMSRLLERIWGVAAAAP
jgi:arylsulfatase A-like enzyme